MTCNYEDLSEHFCVLTKESTHKGVVHYRLGGTEVHGRGDMMIAGLSVVWWNLGVPLI